MPFHMHSLQAPRLSSYLALAILFVSPSIASAAEFYAIVDNLGRRPLNAYLDVAVDTRSGGGVPPEVLFRVYDTLGTLTLDFWAPTKDGFVSTFSYRDLFDLANGQPILVRGSTPTAENFGAALHLEVRGAHIAVGALQERMFDARPFGSGNLFAIPLGGFQKASLLIANVSPGDVDVESFRGTTGSAGTGTSLTPRLMSHGVLKVELSQNDVFSNYVIRSTGLIIVQVVMDDGKTIQSYMVPPSS